MDFENYAIVEDLDHSKYYYDNVRTITTSKVEGDDAKQLLEQYLGL